MWHRAFCRSSSIVGPVPLVEHLHATGLPVVPHFRGDDLGWTSGELVLPGGGTPVHLARYLTQEDDLRDELNAFAAELETLSFNPNSTALMAHVIQTQQLVTLRRPLDHADEATLDRVCVEAMRFFARNADGVYQIDGQGWFAADGTLLVEDF
jgi:hypothetical protein